MKLVIMTLFFYPTITLKALNGGTGGIFIREKKDKKIHIEAEFTVGWEQRFAKAYWELYLEREKRLSKEGDCNESITNF